MGFLRYIHVAILSLVCVCCNTLYAQDNEENFYYERSSLHTMMIGHKNNKFSEVVEQVFKSVPFPERFNDHNLGVKSVDFAETSTDLSSHIQLFCEKVNLGQKMVAKWFNRDKTTGTFNMELVKDRGFYNASQSDINLARKSLRGEALLKDAGENLISNTYLLVNDIIYNSKGTSGGFLKMMASAYVGSAKKMQEQMQAIGGFSVIIRSYLFHLKWNDDIANEFYTKYYTEQEDAEKSEQFKKEKQLFSMEYIGCTESEFSEQHFSKSKEPAALLAKVLTRAIDQNIAQLQHDYEPFRIKAPLISTEPLQAYIGLKEDVSVSRQYEVLERIQNDDGSITYERVGIIKPVSGKIWDNRYLSYEDDDVDRNLKATTFVKVSGKNFFPSMLIREIK